MQASALPYSQVSSPSINFTPSSSSAPSAYQSNSLLESFGWTSPPATPAKVEALIDIKPPSYYQEKAREEHKFVTPASQIPYSSPQSSSPVTSQVKNDALNQGITTMMRTMTQFMDLVDGKLKNLDKQLQQLTLDFQLASSKQEENNNSLSLRLHDLKNSLEQTRSSVVALSAPSPFSAPASQSNAQESADAELAKQLQEEFDQQQQLLQQQSLQQQQRQQPPVEQFRYPSVSSPVAEQKEECPVCGVSLPIGKQLEDHTNSHFSDANPNPNPSPSQPVNIPSQSGQQQSSWVSKVFGKSPVEARQSQIIQQQQQPQPQGQGAELRPPMYSYASTTTKPVVAQQVRPTGAPQYFNPQQSQNLNQMYRSMNPTIPANAQFLYVNAEGQPVYGIPQ